MELYTVDSGSPNDTNVAGDVTPSQAPAKPRFLYSGHPAGRPEQLIDFDEPDFLEKLSNGSYNEDPRFKCLTELKVEGDRLTPFDPADVRRIVFLLARMTTVQLRRLTLTNLIFKAGGDDLVTSEESLGCTISLGILCVVDCTLEFLPVVDNAGILPRGKTALADILTGFQEIDRVELIDILMFASQAAWVPASIPPGTPLQPPAMPRIKYLACNWDTGVYSPFVADLYDWKSDLRTDHCEFGGKLPTGFINTCLGMIGSNLSHLTIHCPRSAHDTLKLVDLSPCSALWKVDIAWQHDAEVIGDRENIDAAFMNNTPSPDINVNNVSHQSSELRTSVRCMTTGIHKPSSLAGQYVESEIRAKFPDCYLGVWDGLTSLIQPFVARGWNISHYFLADVDDSDEPQSMFEQSFAVLRIDMSPNTPPKPDHSTWEEDNETGPAAVVDGSLPSPSSLGNNGSLY